MKYICSLCERREGGSETFESYKRLHVHRVLEHSEEIATALRNEGLNKRT